MPTIQGGYTKTVKFSSEIAPFCRDTSWSKDRMATFMHDFGPFIEKLDVSKYLVSKSIQDSFPDKLVRHFRSFRELRLHRFTMNDAALVA